MKKILVIGSGAWGSALASVLLQNKHYVAIYGIDHNEIKDLIQGYNHKYFGRTKLYKKPNLVSTNLKIIFKNKYDVIILAVPSSSTVVVSKKIKSFIKNKPIFVNCAKGLDKTTQKPLSKQIKNAVKTNKLVSLTGPSFALGVLKHEPTFVNIVSSNLSLAKNVCKLFCNKYFIALPSPHEVGLQYIAACKNIIAIIFGILKGLKTHINTVAGIFSLAIYELSLFLKNKVRTDKPILDLGGIGDIFLTCTSAESRNFQFGYSVAKIGAKKTISTFTKTAEGLVALKLVYENIKKRKHSFPLISSLYDVVYGNKRPSSFVESVIDKLYKF